MSQSPISYGFKAQSVHQPTGAAFCCVFVFLVEVCVRLLGLLWSSWVVFLLAAQGNPTSLIFCSTSNLSVCTKTLRDVVRDPTKDDTIIKTEIPITYGSGTKYEVLKGPGITVKLKISSRKTRY